MLSEHESLLAPIRTRQNNRIKKAQDDLDYLEDGRIKQARLQEFANTLRESQRRLADYIDQKNRSRLTLQAQLESEQRTLTGIVERESSLKLDLKRLEDEQVFRNKQLAENTKLLTELSRIRDQSAAESSADATALLMMSAQLEQMQRRGDAFRERVEVELPDEVAATQDALVEHDLSKGAIENQIAIDKEQLAKFDAGLYTGFGKPAKTLLLLLHQRLLMQRQLWRPTLPGQNNWST